MMHGPDPAPSPMPSKASGLLFGLGLGGFIDGIVLHQILQWHHMVSHVEKYPTTTVAGLEVNTLADGFFHLATWFLVLAGSIAGLRAWGQGRLAPSWSFHFGLLLVGWGAFNLVEGAVDHQILGIHHLRDDLGAPLTWDFGFLGVWRTSYRRWMEPAPARVVRDAAPRFGTNGVGCESRKLHPR